MTMEHSLKTLSGQVYRIDSNSKDYDPELKKGAIEEFGGFEFQILKVEDNTVNGMQAMAVAPIKNDKVDTSDFITAFADSLFNLNTIKSPFIIYIPQTKIENSAQYKKHLYILSLITHLKCFEWTLLMN